MMMCRGDWWVSKVRFLQSAFLIECVSARERGRGRDAEDDDGEEGRVV